MQDEGNNEYNLFKLPEEKTCCTSGHPTNNHYRGKLNFINKEFDVIAILRMYRKIADTELKLR